MQKVTNILFWITTSFLAVMTFLYECELIKWPVVGPMLMFVCGVIALICLYTDIWRDNKRFKKRLRELETQGLPWWQLKEYGGWK